MTTRENIQELNDHLQAFPKAEDIFVKEQPWLKNHFLPLMSIDLAEINPEWAGQKVYMICPFEPYSGCIGEETSNYHNEYTSCNWLAFRLTDDDKFEFLGNEGFFKRTDIHGWDFNSETEKEFQKMKEKYLQNKEGFAEYGYIPSRSYKDKEGNIHKGNLLDRLGGEILYANWTCDVEDGIYPKAFDMKVQTNEDIEDTVVSISYQGNPFYFIADTASYNWCGGYIDAIIMLYEPVSRIVLFTFDYS